MATASKLLSYEEWLLQPENEGPGREECVDGVIEKMAPAKWNHAVIIENLSDQLRDLVDRRKVRIITSDFGLVIRKFPITQRTPDIAVFLRENIVEQDGYIHSAPELAVEVLSPANTPKRVREKLADYASIAIPEVWIINPPARTVTAHCLENGVYTQMQLEHDAVTTPVRFPSVSVDFASIWP